MGGYGCSGYGTKEEFFRKYLYNSVRHSCYDQFLSKHLAQDGRCLSIASGRAVNEMRFVDEGREILCSDLEAICPQETATLFPRYGFVKWNCMDDPLLDQRFQAVISLSFIYLLDPERLQLLFHRVNKLLQPGGIFLLDSAGSPDTFLANILHDYWLPLEAHMVRPLLSAYWRLTGRPGLKVETKHHGFRYTDQELTAMASTAGFKLEAFEAMDFENEWGRSFTYRCLLKYIPPVRRAFLHFGQKIAYVRMFAFRSVHWPTNERFSP